MKTPPFIPRPIACLILLSVFLHLAVSAQAQSIAYTYDRQGRLTGVSYPGGKRITYDYDQNGNLIRRNAVAFVDSDNDGMDDNWEIQAFGTLARDGKGDFDGDGASDLEEYLAGTDPKNSASYLKVNPPGPGSAAGSVNLVWPSVLGRYYRVQYKNNQ